MSIVMSMVKKILLLIFPIISQVIVFGQRPLSKPVLLGAADTCAVVTAEKLYGGSGNDYSAGIINTADGGFEEAYSGCPTSPMRAKRTSD